ncbi:MAG TPA: MltA domain-containing protein [Sphingomicrobium sp.]|nr:MltA domain-containing protein [Sphingomicrobium sp.]
MRLIAGRAFAVVAALLLAACAAQPAPSPVAAPPPAVIPSVPAVPPPPANALAAGVAIVPPAATIYDEWAARALTAFRTSCPALERRQDQSGLAQGADWAPLCTEAATLAPQQAAAFFRDRFDWVRVGAGKAFATGYYEPEIQGSRTPQPGYAPIYMVPPDLVRCTRPDGTTGRGRVDQTGTCTAYYSRAEIEDGALANKNLEIAWAADPVDLFFVEIQGSGRVTFPDGTSIRISYGDQNGLPYTAIGKLLKDRGLLAPGGTSMQAIKDWIRANPDQGRELMRENASYIFFKVLDGPGPVGALNVPVTPHGTVAADPKFVPLGAPVYLAVDRPEAYGLWVAQDTGGAIKGPNRFDTFWGSGPEATQVAGGMAANGVAFILLPKGVAARAVAQH